MRERRIRFASYRDAETLVANEMEGWSWSMSQAKDREITQKLCSYAWENQEKGTFEQIMREFIEDVLEEDPVDWGL